MNHEWKFGQWGRGNTVQTAGAIVRFIGLDDPVTYGLFINKSEVTRKILLDRIEPLPDCTGWDWKPIEPPAGYRLMTDDEIVESGDIYCASGGIWFESTVWGETVVKSKHQSTLAYARKVEPKYRPFANGDEFEPHRERWICSKNIQFAKPYRARVVEYDNDKIWVFGSLGMSYAEAFEHREFADGTPFGVLENER